MRSNWLTGPLSDYVTSRPGNNKIIKGQQSNKPGEGLIQGYSASGPDVWVQIADYNQPGIVISAVGARCGKTFFAEGQWTAIANTQVLLPGKDIDPCWLWYRTNDEEFWIRGGTAQPFVKVRETLEAPCLIPPLPEQQRIVALLDEAFAGLATAKANAERNLQNSRAIFESHLESVFRKRGEGWEERRLEEVCGFQNGFAFKSSTFRLHGCPILRISNIQDGRINATNRIVFFDPNDYREDLDRYRVFKGDLLIAMSGATTGKLGFNVEDEVYYLNQRVGKFEPSERLDPRFLYHFLLTRVEENLRISAGSAQPNLSTEQIKDFLLPLPSIDEQARVVDALEALATETQRLTHLYESKLAALEELKKSLLQQAFNGEL